MQSGLPPPAASNNTDAPSSATASTSPPGRINMQRSDHWANVKIVSLKITCCFPFWLGLKNTQLRTSVFLAFSINNHEAYFVLLENLSLIDLWEIKSIFMIGKCSLKKSLIRLLKITVNALSHFNKFLSTVFYVQTPCMIHQKILRWISLTILNGSEGKWHKISLKNTNCVIFKCHEDQEIWCRGKWSVWIMALLLTVRVWGKLLTSTNFQLLICKLQ